MRYKKRMLAFNAEELYTEHFNKRGINYIDQYVTPTMAHPTPNQIKKMNIIHHSWTHGDKYYKLAHKYYKDSAMWWVIAWFNKKPTESHVVRGEIIYVPTPLNEILKAYGLYY